MAKGSYLESVRKEKKNKKIARENGGAGAMI